MKKAFSLLELIFAIIVISIIASYAIPKYLNIKDTALVSTIKRDINTIITSVQTYYLTQKKISKISDAITINKSNWIISDKKIEDKNHCLSIELKLENAKPSIDLTINDNNKDICKKIKEQNIITTSYELL